MKKITLILGHPDANSFCGALAEQYFLGAQKAGAEIKYFKLGELNFDPILHKGYKEIQVLEPDLVRLQEAIKWAEHLVFVYPIWWGTMPALMKGFFDRAFLSGFAFKYRRNSWRWDKLLAGRSAHLIVTKDTPEFFYKLFFSQPGYQQMKKVILGFSGIAPIKITDIGPVRYFPPEKISTWLKRAYQLGLQLK